MDSTDEQSGKRRMMARYQFTDEEEEQNEEEYPEEWSTRKPSSARRYRNQADVRAEAGRVDDALSPGNRSRYSSQPGPRRTIPPRRTATEEHLPPLQALSPVRPSSVERYTEEGLRIRGPRRLSKLPRWLVVVGIGMMIMIFGWIILSALGSWWQTTVNDWRYGRPRTFQVDAVVGHNDSPQHPSHFIAMNLNQRIVIIEMPGGDPSKTVVFNGPTLVGTGQNLTPVTLTFQDVNHDGKLDMIVNIQGSQFIFLNEHGTFVPISQSAGSSG